MALSTAPTLEPDERRLIRALQIDPRVPFATMSAVLGLSEPTVSRRYSRLCRAGVLRVTGVVDPGALGQSQWMVRLRCRAGSGAPIAEALAHRDDVSWVAVGVGGAEVTCAVRARSPEQREDLLGNRLSRSAAVQDVDAVALLHKFLGGRGRYWAALSGVLTDEQESRLGSTGNPFVEADVVSHPSTALSEQDEALLAALAADGRASIVELAAAAGLTTGRATRRLRTLLAERVAHIHVEIAAAALGLRARANLWLQVHPANVTAVGRALARMPEVGYVAAMSGRHNVHAVLDCRDLDEVYAFTTKCVGPLEGVQSAEVSPIHQQIKQAATLLTADGLLETAKPRRR